MNYEYQPPIRTGLIEFLQKTSGGQFVIPVYQRNYTWTANKELKQYLDDLKTIIDKKNSKHFMGIMIYLTHYIDGFGTSEFSVIDGQQRLTTTFLILYAIRDILKETNEEQKLQQLENYILTNSSSSEKYRYKLKPLVADDEVYQKIVQGELDQINESDSNVYKNFIFIRNFLDSLIEHGINLSTIMEALNKLYIVGVPISKDDNAQKIFESINSTGSKLTASDLIRNYILMEINSDEQDLYYFKYWKKIEHNISNNPKKLESFFRFYLASKFYKLPNISIVYNTFKDWFNQQKEIEENNIENILQDILSYAIYYNNLYIKEANNFPDALRRSIINYRKHLSDMPAPFLMEMWNLYETNDEFGNRLISAQKLAEIIEVINIYLMRRSLSGLDTSDITRLFPTVLKDVIMESKNDLQNIVEYVKKSLINKNRGKSSMMPDDQYLRNFLQNANAYNLRSTIRIAFEFIENIDNDAPVEQSKLSIEHLMPQTPTDEWLKDSQIATREDYEKYLNQIGNLTLAARRDNSKMRNRQWDIKKDILKSTSHLKINETILSKDSWTVNDITERTDSLIDQIVKYYPYITASDDVIIKHHIQLNFNGVSANGILYEEDGSVEILEGSQMVNKPEDSAFQYLEDLYLELIEDGTIIENEVNTIFKKSYVFLTTRNNDTALSASVSFLLRSGNRNGWEYWKNENGESINSNKQIKLKFTNR